MFVFHSLHLIFWIVVVDITCAQDVIFGDLPGVTSGSGGSTCTTKQGGSGSCVEFRKCPEIRKTFFTDPPVHCGFSGTAPIVCCPVNTEPVTGDPTVGLVRVQNISSPDFSSDFVCGRSATQRISSDLSSRFRRAKPFFGKVPGFHISVVGGRDSLRNAWPWMALLGTREGGNEQINWFCGGLLINDQWVLTAAHCLTLGSPDVIRLGEHNYNDDHDEANHQDFDILKMVRYPDYSYPGASHDLALVQLAKKVALRTFISPVCLPWGDESLKNLVGKSVKLTGWGDTQFAGNPSSVLQEVDLTIFKTSKCQESYSKLRLFRQSWPNGMGKETVCAGDVNGGRDACQGDSGGPITYRADNGRYVVNGIVSTGYGCGNEDFPGIYANVQYPPHLAWIKKTAF